MAICCIFVKTAKICDVKPFYQHEIAVRTPGRRHLRDFSKEEDLQKSLKLLHFSLVQCWLIGARASSSLPFYF